MAGEQARRQLGGVEGGMMSLGKLKMTVRVSSLCFKGRV